MTVVKSVLLSFTLSAMSASAYAHPGHVAENGAGHDHFLSLMLGLVAVVLALLVIVAGRARRQERSVREKTAQQ